MQLFDGISRIISRNDPWRSETDKGTDGLITIRELKYSIMKESLNPNDNVYTIENASMNAKVFYINILSFLTEIPYESQAYFSYDLREPKRQIVRPKGKEPFQINNHLSKKIPDIQDWTKIPYYPTVKERREQYATQLQKQLGGVLPPQLVSQLQKDRLQEIQSDAFNRHLLSSSSSSLSSSSSSKEQKNKKNLPILSTPAPILSTADVKPKYYYSLPPYHHPPITGVKKKHTINYYLPNAA